MDKNNIVKIVLLVIILAVGFIAFKFYSESQNLANENGSLKEEGKRLVEENKNLQYKYAEIQQEANGLNQRLAAVGRDLSRIQQERDDLQKKYENSSREKEMLLEKIRENQNKQPQVQVSQAIVPQERYVEQPAAGNSEYWADFVKVKAELQAQSDELNRQLIEVKNNLAESDRKNKELSIKIDEFTKDREELQREIEFKKRTMDIMSRDLVSERESRKVISEQMEKMRSDNVSLKRELVMGNKEKFQLTNQMQGLMAKKDNLEKRISEIENILKEKSMALDDLQDSLGKAIKGDKTLSQESVSVELPPIVVNSDSKTAKGLRGTVIAVNPEEKFIVIDAGESSGIRPGMQMRVVRGDKNVAMVEVIETRRDISAADIKETISGVTVAEGDIAISK